MAYTALAMTARFLGGGYKLPGGQFLSGVPIKLQPSFGTVGAQGVFHPSSFILICMLSTAYMAHFNAPKFYNELKDNTIQRYNTVVGTSFGISIAIFITITSMGFLTFGKAASGLILNNYSVADRLMGLSRVAVAISLVFSYPLVFAGARDGVLDLFSLPAEKRTNARLNKLTAILLSLITGLALVVKDLSFVLSFGGATLGNALIYVYPALMFRKAVKQMGDKASPGLKRESALSLVIASLGVGMGLIGSKMAIRKLLSH
jgi:amino acid permease